MKPARPIKPVHQGESSGLGHRVADVFLRTDAWPSIGRCVQHQPVEDAVRSCRGETQVGGVNGTKVLGNEVGTGRRVGRKQSPDRPLGRVCADAARQHALEDQSRSFVVERHRRAEHAAGNTLQKRQGRCLPGLIQLIVSEEAEAEPTSRIETSKTERMRELRLTRIEFRSQQTTIVAVLRLGPF